MHPPKTLLIRGRAELYVVGRIPNEYLEASGTLRDDARATGVNWEAKVRLLYDGMVRIVVTPTWAEADRPKKPTELCRGAGR